LERPSSFHVRTEVSKMSLEGAAAARDVEPQDQEQPAEAADNEVAKGKKRLTSGVDKEKDNDKERVAKRPRWGDKAFEEITIADVEQLVRKCNSLEKKLEADSELASRLKELQSDKKDLERQIVEVGPDAVARVKACIAKQLLSQMIYVSAWEPDLKKGRSITAFLPNVSAELLKALGGGTSAVKDKMTAWYFDPVPSKSIPASARKADASSFSTMVLGPNITLKFVKTTSELQVTTTYTLKKEKKPKGKARGKGKALAKAKDAQDGEGCADADGEDGEDGDEAELSEAGEGCEEAVPDAADDRPAEGMDAAGTEAASSVAVAA